MVLVTQEHIDLTLVSEILPCLNKKSVIFLDESSRDKAIEKLVDHLDETCHIEHKQEFFKAVLEREEVASTGIGMGIAIPHAKLDVYDEFFMTIGILSNGVSWNAMDQMPVKVIFLLGGPDDKQTHYLKLLSQLTFFLRDEEKRAQLFKLTHSEEILDIFNT